MRLVRQSGVYFMTRGSSTSVCARDRGSYRAHGLFPRRRPIHELSHAHQNPVELRGVDADVAHRYLYVHRHGDRD